jgi:outer membrane lipoprotein SlyB
MNTFQTIEISQLDNITGGVNVGGAVKPVANVGVGSAVGSAVGSVGGAVVGGPVGSVVGGRVGSVVGNQVEGVVRNWFNR